MGLCVCAISPPLDYVDYLLASKITPHYYILNLYVLCLTGDTLCGKCGALHHSLFPFSWQGLSLM